jgi:hypothetical protein
MRLIEWIPGLLSARRKKAPPASAVTSDHHRDQRTERRYAFGAKAPLIIDPNYSITCDVADACRRGLRLLLREPLPAGVTPTVVLHFNGVYLRRPLDIVWTRQDIYGIEVGARFADADERTPQLDNFVRYLQWKSTAMRVA